MTGPLLGGLDARVRVTRGGFELDVAIRALPHQPLAVVGPNGAGKSTLLQALAGIVPLATGGSRGVAAGDPAIRLGDRELADAASGRALPVAERRVGYVFQDHLLFPHLSVLDNVAFAPRVAGGTRAEARAAARGWLERLGVAELADRRPDQVSGGQAQRIAVARALASEPELLLLDEPLAALDAETRVEVRDELARHLADFAGPSILVTHSRGDVRRLAAYLLVIERGAAAQYGTTDEVLGSPGTPFVRRLADGDFG